MKYIGNARMIESKYGVMPKITFHVDDLKKLIEFMESNDMKFININLKEKKKPSETGLTHYGEIDLWKKKDEDLEKKDLPF